MRKSFNVFWFLLLISALSSSAQESSFVSAWEDLVADQPDIAGRATALEREILLLLSRVQLDQYLSGVDPALIELRDGKYLSDFLADKGAESFDIYWYTVDGGGGASSGGGFVVSGGIGQPDARATAMVGGGFSLVGGFWAATTEISLEIFMDDFETGDTSRWSNVVGEN